MFKDNCHIIVSKITMAGNVVPYYTVTTLTCSTYTEETALRFFELEVAPVLPWEYPCRYSNTVAVWVLHNNSRVTSQEQHSYFCVGTYSQQWVTCIHCLTQTYIDFHCTQVKVGQKRRWYIFTYRLQNFLISSNQVQIKSINCHWVRKLSQKWLLKVKNGMKSDNKSFHLGLWIGIFPFTLYWLLSFKCLVQIYSPFTVAHWHARLSQRIQ